MSGTEEPTPKRLRKAREEGDSGASTYASQAIAFLVAVALAPGAVRALAGRSTVELRAAIARAAEPSPAVSVDASALAADVIALALPVLVAAGVAGAVATLVQTGGFIATKRVALKLERLNVFSGLASLFSGVRAFSVARAFAAAAVVAWLAERALASHLADLAHTTGRIAYVGVAAGAIAVGVARDAALVGLAIAVIDVLVVRRAWLKKLRMSKDEVKREHKESEGDPHVKAARDRAHREMLAAATVGNVKNATVVVVNPTHLASALRYDQAEGDEAPVVVASGEGDLAARIVAAARDHGVPVVRDVPLARALFELSVGDAIPEALYEAVAEILRDAHAHTDTP